MPKAHATKRDGALLRLIVSDDAVVVEPPPRARPEPEPKTSEIEALVPICGDVDLVTMEWVRAYRRGVKWRRYHPKARLPAPDFFGGNARVRDLLSADLPAVDFCAEQAFRIGAREPFMTLADWSALARARLSESTDAPRASAVRTASPRRPV